MQIEEKEAVKPTPGDSINEFVQKHRKPIFFSTAVILLALIAFIIVLFVIDIVRGKAINTLEEFNTRYEELLPSITEDYSALDVEQLLTELEAFARGKSGYAAGKAWAIAANIYGQKKDWPAAEKAWLSSAKAAKKNYLSPIAFFNAAAAAEEQGKTTEAIEYYTSSLSSLVDFPAAPRAQFSIGRLQESLGNNEAAIEAYRAVIAKWSYDTVWPNLAHSRIIVLEE